MGRGVGRVKNPRCEAATICGEIAPSGRSGLSRVHPLRADARESARKHDSVALPNCGMVPRRLREEARLRRASRGPAIPLGNARLRKALSMVVLDGPSGFVSTTSGSGPRANLARLPSSQPCESCSQRSGAWLLIGDPSCRFCRWLRRCQSFTKLERSFLPYLQVPYRRPDCVLSRVLQASHLAALSGLLAFGKLLHPSKDAAA